jgi:hypothetical protein
MQLISASNGSKVLQTEVVQCLIIEFGWLLNQVLILYLFQKYPQIRTLQLQRLSLEVTTNLWFNQEILLVTVLTLQRLLSEHQQFQMCLALFQHL